MLRELAPAKVNLTLRVHGRRADGYHEIESLVVFAEQGDALSFVSAPENALTFTGPFASQLIDDPENLVERARSAFVARFPNHADQCQGVFALEKNLPVASGIGGGSADAAATLRLLAQLCKVEDHAALMDVALSVGADVPVCLRGTSCIMSGVGERISPLKSSLPAFWMLLVNPCVAVSTLDVFVRLQAPTVSNVTPMEQPDITTFDALTDHIALIGNDLMGPAYSLVPDLADVGRALQRDAGSVCAWGMSGSGATHFALYRDETAAREGHNLLLSSNPDWWVTVGLVGAVNAKGDDVQHC